MATAAEMIEALGGVRKTAAALGVPPTTVQHWKSCNSVPGWRERDLTEAYEKRPPVDEAPEQASAA